MKHGTVVQRHTRDCPRNEDGTFARHRCKGSWRWVLEYGHDSSGGRLQTSKSGYATRAAAQTALQDAVRIFKADVIVHSMTVEEYLTSWLAGKHALKPKTVELYTGLTRNYLAPHLGQVRLLELRAHHLEAMYGGLKIGRKGRPLSPTTIRRIHGVLRSALNSAVRRRLLSFNPADHIELAPETPRRPRPWTAKQAQTFLASIESDRLPYHLLLVTGLRRGEAIGLRWEDVDLDSRGLFVVQQITEVNGRPVVGTPKTKRGVRLVPVDSETVALLCRHREGQQLERSAWGPEWDDEGLVFTREDGSPLRPGYVTRHFEKLAQDAGLPPLRLHDLRHTNASLALQAGVDLKVVSERLGHSQLAVTADLYTHVHRGLGQDAADRIAAALSPASDPASEAGSETGPDAFPAASLPQTPRTMPVMPAEPSDQTQKSATPQS